MRSCSVLTLATALQVLTGQIQAYGGPYGPHSANDPRQGPLVDPIQESIPRHCWAPPAGVSPYECCPIPKLFPEEQMSACGIEKTTADSAPPPNDRPQLPDCEKGTCLLKSKDLIDDKKVIDFDKLRAFIDDWAKANPDFSDAIKIAKNKCFANGVPPGPPHICPANRVFFCLTANILWNCNLRKDLAQCKILQEHMDECKPFYIMKMDEVSL